MCYLIPKERRFYENMKNSFSFLAKHISWKYIVLILILIYIILLTVPYLPHKTVSEEYKEKDAAAEYYSDTSGTERIAYITDNNDALLYRLGMIEEAEKSIILSTFDFNDDEAGQDILSALLNAADRGVDIRVIVDGISGFMDVQHNPWFLALDAHKNAQVRIYNPVNFLKPWDMQARLHDKYLIIDDQMYTLGRTQHNKPVSRRLFKRKKHRQGAVCLRNRSGQKYAKHFYVPASNLF